jgi:polyhydroxyalkanoate synthesis regulator phasin
MARDERLKKVQDAGADFLETARAKAEEFLRELSRASGDTQDRAQDAIDDLVGSGRKGTGQFASAVRKEIQNQLAALGLATKDDLDALERRLTGHPAAAKKATAKKATAKKATAEKAAPAKKAAAKKAPAKKAPAPTPPTPGPAASSGPDTGPTAD